MKDWYARLKGTFFPHRRAAFKRRRARFFSISVELMLVALVTLVANSHLQANINDWLRFFGSTSAMMHDFQNAVRPLSIYQGSEISGSVLPQLRKLCVGKPPKSVGLSWEIYNHLMGTVKQQYPYTVFERIVQQTGNPYRYVSHKAFPSHIRYVILSPQLNIPLLDVVDPTPSERTEDFTLHEIVHLSMKSP